LLLEIVIYTFKKKSLKLPPKHKLRQSEQIVEYKKQVADAFAVKKSPAFEDHLQASSAAK
jgi:hypothetical protein